MRSRWIKVELNPIDKCPYKRREGQKTHREGTVKSEAENGEMHLQTKGCQRVPTCTRS